MRVYHLLKDAGLKNAIRRGVKQGPSAQRETARVDVHACDANVLEGCGQEERHLGWDVTQQVRVLFTALQLEGGVVQHLLVLVTGLFHLQSVDLSTQAH